MMGSLARQFVSKFKSLKKRSYSNVKAIGHELYRAIMAAIRAAIFNHRTETRDIEALVREAVSLGDDLSGARP